jgi:hypothetical protein
LPGIVAFEIDKGIKSMDTANALVCIAALDNELGDALTDIVVERGELVGG